MTKREFTLSMPDIITHKTSGYGDLEVVEDTLDNKSVCYRHWDSSATCTTSAPTWLELHAKFSKLLISKGYMKASLV